MFLGSLLFLTAHAAEIDTQGPIVRDTEIGWKRRHGVGVVVGQPIGLTGKTYLDRRGRHAVDASLGAQTLGGLYGHASYLFHPFPLIRTTKFEIPWHIGGGGFWGTAQQTVGVRGTAGLDLDVTHTPLQLFADLNTQFGVAPSAGLGVGFSAGARYYF
jgi:hypothetical protein